VRGDERQGTRDKRQGRRDKGQGRRDKGQHFLLFYARSWSSTPPGGAMIHSAGAPGPQERQQAD